MRLALLALRCRYGCAPRGGFQGPRVNIQAKLNYRERLPARSAQGSHRYFPIPRLAGQQPEYLKSQLEPSSNTGEPATYVQRGQLLLGPGMISALAADFHALDPPPLGGGARHLVPIRRKIFQNGVPGANIAACAACHGPEAQGSGEIPRLAGQLPVRLQQFSRLERRTRSEPPSQTYRRHVSGRASLLSASGKLVAAYLSYLR